MHAQILIRSTYRPSRGGHAPGDVRDAFLEAIDAHQAWQDGEPEPTVDLRDQAVPISRVCGLLWNCSDVLPGVAATQLRDLLTGREGDRRVSPYATAARLLKGLVERAQA